MTRGINIQGVCKNIKSTRDINHKWYYTKMCNVLNRRRIRIQCRTEEPEGY
jgi:hypothetical protein